MDSGHTFAQVVPAHFPREDRPLQAVRRVRVHGAIDVFFRRSEQPQLVVAGEDQAAIDSVVTKFIGDTLIVEPKGSTIGGGLVNVGCVIGGSVYVNGASNTRKMVGLALSELGVVEIKGSADVTLLDLQQKSLELRLAGSGDIFATGSVHTLEVVVAGSGDVNASGLNSKLAVLSVAGSGDIDAVVSEDVTAIVMGSGDIVVKGGASSRSQSVSGSGSVKIK